MTRVPIFIMAASSGPEAGTGTGAASFRDSSSTVAEPPCGDKLKSSSLLSVLGPGGQIVIIKNLRFYSEICFIIVSHCNMMHSWNVNTGLKYKTQN